MYINFRNMGSMEKLSLLGLMNCDMPKFAVTTQFGQWHVKNASMLAKYAWCLFL